MIDVMTAVRTVYVLHDLEHRAYLAKTSEDSPIAWHYKERLTQYHADVKAALAAEAGPLARAFRDYIVLTAAGEARHARLKADYYWEGFHTSNVYRTRVYPDVERYNPDDVLREAVALFDCEWRGGGYGGHAWKRIVEVGQRYGTIPDLMFLDVAVDLSHNSGLFLDKGVLLALADVTEYKDMLDRKTSVGLLTKRWWEVIRTLTVHETVAHLLTEGRELGLHTCLAESAEAPDYDYDLIEWGNEPFKPELVEVYGESDCDEDDTEDEDDEEEEEQEEDELVTETLNPAVGYYEPFARCA